MPRSVTRRIFNTHITSPVNREAYEVLYEG